MLPKEQCVPRKYTWKVKVNSVCQVAFYHKELSKRSWPGQLPEASVIIRILLLVSLALVVGTLAPKGGRIFVFFFAKQKLSPGKWSNPIEQTDDSFLLSVHPPSVTHPATDSHYHHNHRIVRNWII